MLFVKKTSVVVKRFCTSYASDRSIFSPDPATLPVEQWGELHSL